MPVTSANIGNTDNVRINGATDDTEIGNVGDRLKVDALVTVTPAASTFGTILKQAEVTIASKTETDISATSYTVTTGKSFVLTSISANYDNNSPVIIRLKKQTGGTGSFVTQFRLTLEQHGQDPSNATIQIPYGVKIGSATDVFKLTYEAALIKGAVWACFTGLEY